MTSDAEQDDRSRSPSADESGESDAGDDHDMEARPNNGTGDRAPKKAASKDPSRPRRKKARRACYACQRAHLTCGDERPCQRCIKRGLHETCQDGVRKKAKYLHDAPPEALMPGSANRYPYMNNLQPAQQSQSSPTYNLSGTDAFGRQSTSAYSGYGASPPGSAALPLNENLISPGFTDPQSPLASQMPAGPGLSTTNLQGLAPAMRQQAVPAGGSGIAGAGLDGSFFDAGELAQYDFDPNSFNFGNHYGALEFGMLGHLSSGAIAGSPPGDAGSAMNQGLNAFATPNTLSTSNYGESPVDGNQSFVFNPDSGMGDWRPAQTQSNLRQGAGVLRGKENGIFPQDNPRAFSVGMGSAVASPTSARSPEQYKEAGRARYPSSPRKQAPGEDAEENGLRVRGRPSSQAVFNLAPRAFGPKRKRGDPSEIYKSVTQPYSYITGFHNLILLLQQRFPPAKVLRIAKALASIRPSFISSTRNLARDDLIFMEKCFQRTLWEYEDFINACGTPTVVCRRTGEIAAAGKEFSILTRWRRDILLGREANLNVNAGAASQRSSQTGPEAQGLSGASSSARGGTNTPRIPEHMIDHSRPHPVSLAELLDADSVVAFYEDFARLAFGDSKGVITTRYKLLKYRTKEEEAQLMAERDARDAEGRPMKRKRGSDSGPHPTKPGQISGEAGIDELGDAATIECSCCWTVKRDIFDLPMMIVMNFLPCI